MLQINVDSNITLTLNVYLFTLGLMQEELGSVQIGCYVAHTSELGEFSHADLYEIQKFSRPVI